MPGLSTSLFGRKNLPAEYIIEKSLALGADYLELEYRLSPVQFTELLELCKKQNIEIKSLHNFCPRPDSVPQGKEDGDYYSLSSLDNTEWHLAVNATLSTLSNCNRAEAGRAVLHLGHAADDLKKNWFKNMVDDGTILIPKNKKLINDYYSARKENTNKHLDQVRRAIDALLPTAEKEGVILCLENRYYPGQIPSFDELGTLITEYATPHVASWIDWGHAVATGLFGDKGLDEYLETYGFGSAGFHIHDALGHRDHLPPGSGEINFSHYAKYLKKSACNIIELRPFDDENVIKKSIEFISSLEKGTIAS